MRFLLLLLLLSSVACKQNKEKATTQTTADNAAATAKTETPKTIRNYFEAFKKMNEIDAKDSVIVHEENDDFIKFEHFPKSGEIIGTIFITLRKLKTETGEPKFLQFMHACVEGSCNLQAINLKVYSADWKDITATSLDISAIQKELDKEVKTFAKNGKKKRFTDFFARIDANSDKFEYGLIDPEDQNMMQGKTAETVFGLLKEMSWDVQNQKFVFTSDFKPTRAFYADKADMHEYLKVQDIAKDRIAYEIYMVNGGCEAFTFRGVARLKSGDAESDIDEKNNGYFVNEYVDEQDKTCSITIRIGEDKGYTNRARFQIGDCAKLKACKEKLDSEPLFLRK